MIFGVFLSCLFGGAVALLLLHYMNLREDKEMEERRADHNAQRCEHMEKKNQELRTRLSELEAELKRERAGCPNY